MNRLSIRFMFWWYELGLKQFANGGMIVRIPCFMTNPILFTTAHKTLIDNLLICYLMRWSW